MRNREYKARLINAVRSAQGHDVRIITEATKWTDVPRINKLMKGIFTALGRKAPYDANDLYSLIDDLEDLKTDIDIAIKMAYDREDDA